MKRKLLNAALFGAVLIAAPVSTFVSCADYESDINSVQQSVDNLADAVNKKEAAINDQIKNLDAQVKALDEAYKKADADLKAQLEKAIKDGDANLQAQIEDCQAKCKAEFAAVRAELAAAKAELQDALEAAKKELTDAHNADVAKLLAADVELQNGIDAAKAEIAAAKVDIENVKGDLEGFKAQTNNEIEQIYQQLEGVTQQISQVYNTLNDQINVLNGEIENIKANVNAVKADLLAKITENTNAIKDNKENLDKHIAEFNAHKQAAETEFANIKADLAKKANQADVDKLEQTLRGLIQANAAEIAKNAGDIAAAKADIAALQAAVAALQAQDAIHTKAIADNALRILDLEAAVAENTKNLLALTDAFEAYKVAQAAVDAAQNAALTQAVADLNQRITGEVATLNNTITAKYQDALQKAQQAADAAEANAKAYAKAYTDGALTNYYTQAQVDAFISNINTHLGVLDADVDAIYTDLSLFHDDFNTFRTECKTAIADLKADVAANKADIATNKARIEEVYNEVLGITDDLYRECGAIRDLITLRVSELNERMDDIEAAYKAADAKMAADFREWCEQDLLPALAGLQDQIDELGVDLSALAAEVKSLVLEPASYYEGIQAIEGTSYEYTKWNVADALNPVQDGDVTTYCPSVTAHYHVNPSAAKMMTGDKDMDKYYQYAVLDRLNRGVNEKLQPVVTKVAKNGGMIDVTLRLTDATANKTPQVHQDPSEVTVMALQYTNPAAINKDQVVTSDYAVLYLNPLKEVALVHASDHHDIGDASAFAELDYVPYNTENAYDIQAQLKTSFGGEAPLTLNGEKWPEGFTYRYTWVAGDKSYFTTITEDGKVKPQLPNGQPATTACVGKTSTWRIDVMHGDDIVEVGFYKLTITGEAVIETAPAVVTEDILPVTCDPTDEALNANLDLVNVWTLVAETTGESVDTVKTKYAVSKTQDGKVAQFAEYLGEGDRILYKQYAGKGVVTLNGEKVNWVILHNDPAVEAELLSETKDMKSLKTYIRVRSLDAISKDTYNEFYLPLVWTPKPIEFWGESQEVSWKYERVANQWQSNKVTREEHELRLYADLTDDVTPVKYQYDIRNKAMKGEFENKLIGTAAEFVNVKNGRITLENGHFRFIEHPVKDARFYDVVLGIDADGNDIHDTYELTVSPDGSQLLAGRGKSTPVVIATITPAGVVSLENNATAQILLNAYEKDELGYGQTLCARVGYEVECCAGDVEVVEGDFDVRFIKPLTVVAQDIDIYDADDTTNSGIIVKSVLDQIKCFNGYSLAERPQYKGLFQVYVDMGTPNDWYTNYDADENDFSKQIKNHPSIKDLFFADADKGEITYENNTAVVSDFSVIVPVKVINVWNLTPVEVTIKLNVHRTKDNSNRR